MSNNAVAAYGMGRMPLSKWSKSTILAAADEYLTAKNDPMKAEKLACLRRCKLKKLKRHLLTYTEWHHTSCLYNKTAFFGLHEFVLDELTFERAAEWCEDEKKLATPAEPTRKIGSIEYIIWGWGGTRKYPKAYKKRLDNVEIEEKGSFYIVSKDGKQVLKKKIGSNGTFVKYNN